MNRNSAPGLPWRWGSIEGIDTPRRIREDEGDREGVRWRLASRAVETSAPPESLFLWLCQLRRYNCVFGRSTPRTPDPAFTELAVGQPMMKMFCLVDFVPDHSITIQVLPGRWARIFTSLVVRYSAVPLDEGRALLRGDLWVPRSDGPVAWLRRCLLAWGSLVMMRKQLRTLSQLAEHPQVTGQ